MTSDKRPPVTPASRHPNAGIRVESKSKNHSRREQDEGIEIEREPLLANVDIIEPDEDDEQGIANVGEKPQAQVKLDNPKSAGSSSSGGAGAGNPRTRFGPSSSLNKSGKEAQQRTADYNTSWGSQFLTLSGRAFKNFVRNFFLMPAHYGSAILMGLLLGAV